MRTESEQIVISINNLRTAWLIRKLLKKLDRRIANSTPYLANRVVLNIGKLYSGEVYPNRNWIFRMLG